MLVLYFNDVFYGIYIDVYDISCTLFYFLWIFCFSQGFKNNNNAESIHGSLLTIGELLVNSGDFMLARFKEVCDTVLKYTDHRDRLVWDKIQLFYFSVL